MAVDASAWQATGINHPHDGWTRNPEKFSGLLSRDILPHWRNGKLLPLRKRSGKSHDSMPQRRRERNIHSATAEPHVAGIAFKELEQLVLNGS